MTLTLAATGAMALALFAPTAAAQPDRDRTQRESDVANAPNRDEAIGHLRQRLERMDAERARLSEAINRLDSGESWEAVSADLPGRGGRVTDGPRQRGRDGDRRQDASPGPGQARDRGGNQGKPDNARLREMLREVDPEMSAQLEQLSQRNPKMARRLLLNAGPRLLKLARLRESNPALFDIEAENFRIEHRIMQTARALHGAIAGPGANNEPDISIDGTRERLRGLVARQVDLQIQGQRLQLESAQGKIERLRASIDERIESRDAVINERVERIMDRAVRGGVNTRQRGSGEGRPGQRQRHRPDRP